MISISVWGLTGCSDKKSNICSSEFKAEYDRFSWMSTYEPNEWNNTNYNELKAILDKYKNHKDDLKKLEAQPSCLKDKSSSLWRLDPKNDYGIQSTKTSIYDKIQTLTPGVDLISALEDLKTKTGIQFVKYLHGDTNYLEHLIDLVAFEAQRAVSSTIHEAYEAVTQFQTTLQNLDRDYPTFRASAGGYYLPRYLARADNFIKIIDSVQPNRNRQFREFLQAEPARRNQAEREAQERVARERQDEVERQRQVRDAAQREQNRARQVEAERQRQQQEAARIQAERLEAARVQAEHQRRLAAAPQQIQRAGDATAYSEIFPVLTQNIAPDQREAWSTLIRRTIPRFWELTPTFENVIALIQKMEVSTQPALNAVIELKRTALVERHLVQTGAHYQSLMSELIPGGFRNELYYERNSVLVLGTYSDFLENRRNLSRRDLNNLKAFILSPAIHAEFREQAENYVTQLINRRIEQIPAQMRALVLTQLELRVRTLFDRLHPNLEQGLFRYYLLRPEALAAEVATNRIIEGMSLINLEAFTEEAHGTQCPHHNPQDRVGYHVRNTAPADQVNNSDLYGHIRGLMGEQVFPIHCGGVGAHHELPLTPVILEQAGFNAKGIFEWQTGTLLSYYQELLRLQRGEPVVHEAPIAPAIPDYRVCPTPECGAPILADQRNPGNHHAQCQVCDQQRCYLCEHAHIGMNCEQRAAHQGRPDFFNPEGNLRPCPYCGTPAAKDDNCNSVFCAACQQEWHFVRGAPRVGTPFFDLHSFNRDRDQNGVIILPLRVYRVEGEADYVEGMESAFPRNQGEIRNLNRMRRGAQRYQN